MRGTSFGLPNYEVANSAPATIPLAAFATFEFYPIKIDGNTKTVEVRRGTFAELGFTVVVKD